MSEIDEDVMKRAEQLCVKHGLISNRAVLSDVARALMAERKADKWQPIETAPKDETILVVVVVTPQNQSFVGRAPTTHPAYVDEYGRMCNVGTWLPDGGLDGDFWRATHWQPLPPPPPPKGASHDQA